MSAAAGSAFAQSAAPACDAPTSAALNLLADESLTSALLLTRLEALTREAPACAGVWDALGRARERFGDADRAIPAWRRALELDATNGDLWLRFGILLKRDRRDPDGAVDALTRALAAGAPRPRTLNELGVAYAYQGQMKKALDTWMGAVEESPGWGVLYSNALKAALALGDPALAAEIYRRGAQAENPEENLYIQWGEYLLKDKKRKEAIAVYETGAARLPQSAMIAYYHGQALLEADRKDEARARLESAAALDPEGPKGRVAIWSRRALFILDHPRDEKKFQECVRRFFEALREKEPKRTRELERVERDTAQLVRAHPDFWNAWETRAWTLRRLGRYEEARAALDHVLELHPGEPNAYHELGLLLRETGHLEEARAQMLRALSIAPRDAATLMNLAICEAELGRFGDAEERLKAAEERIGAENVAPLREYISALRNGTLSPDTARPQAPVGSFR